MDDVKLWFNNLPQFTRYWFGGSVTLSLAGRVGLIPAQYMVLYYYPFIHQFQIWRPVTALFFSPISFHYLINLYFLVNYSKLLETGEFVQRPADYATMLLFNWLLTSILALFMNVPVLMDAMVMTVIYLWCNLHENQIVNFWFGTQFPAKFLPWVLFGFSWLISGGGVSEIIGIIVGHMYFFIKYKYPQDYHGRELITTPAILETYFPRRAGVQSGFGAAPAFRPNTAPRDAGGHSWGTGRSLGGN